MINTMHVISKMSIVVQELVDGLKAGQTIVYPTETCYGLGCDATNPEAVEKIFAIKGRDPGKSVLMLATDVAMVKQCVVWDEVLEDLAQQYWPLVVSADDHIPGLTMVLPLKPGANLAPGVIGADGTVAFRVSRHPIASQIVTALGRPLVSTSANVAGGPNPYSLIDIETAFGTRDTQPDMVIDAGTLPERPPTTIIRVRDGQIEVLRQGELRII